MCGIVMCVSHVIVIDNAQFIGQKWWNTSARVIFHPWRVDRRAINSLTKTLLENGMDIFNAIKKSLHECTFASSCPSFGARNTRGHVQRFSLGPPDVGEDD